MNEELLEENFVCCLLIIRLLIITNKVSEKLCAMSIAKYKTRDFFMTTNYYETNYLGRNFPQSSPPRMSITGCKIHRFLILSC